MICPELLLSTLVGAVDPLADYEAMYIHGAIQFTDYVGYGSSFECSGYVEGVEPQQPSWVIVMDALHFGQHSAHQATQHVLRELNKCHIALTAPGLPDGVAFATGNWGCGVFGGDPQLKSILQVGWVPRTSGSSHTNVVVEVTLSYWLADSAALMWTRNR
ncbi:hypothetical protein FOZ63_011134 [Perkinsus olseni]|uniref:PARG catalytic Macro domain-containing protein n=1 Tax=Perkinsus olseni TaxID=32597 RepID=A0A7J6PSR0_PEROL|nr:hypothetical protein FOZ63_011134 [Perkinsus olseni]